MVTKNKFKRFEAVRRSGSVNMFDYKDVMKTAKISKLEYMAIIKNYEKYSKEYTK